MNYLAVTWVLLFFPFHSLATKGVDVSAPVTEENWKCLRKEGYSFALVRIFRSLGSVDPNGAQTIKNARSAGIKYVDGYIFPCPKCGDGKGQVKKALDNLREKGAKIGQLWLDVEGPEYWSQNDADNVQFIQDMVDQANAEKVKVAMYTSHYQWRSITGDSKKFGDLQLWYAHYDKVDKFEDFKPFGAWTKPAIKQYEGDVKICGVQLDKNWYP